MWSDDGNISREDAAAGNLARRIQRPFLASHFAFGLLEGIQHRVDPQKLARSLAVRFFPFILDLPTFVLHRRTQLCGTCKIDLTRGLIDSTHSTFSSNVPVISISERIYWHPEGYDFNYSALHRHQAEVVWWLAVPEARVAQEKRARTCGTRKARAHA